MSRYVAIFPIHHPAPDNRHHRAALNQLHELVPGNVTITGEWTGHTWTDPDGRHWYVISAPAEGTPHTALIDAVQATAHHIHPALEAWTRGEQATAAPTTTPHHQVNNPDGNPAPLLTATAKRRKHTDQRIAQLAEALEQGRPLDAILAELDWTASAAAQALRRRGHPYAREVGSAAQVQRRRRLAGAAR